MAVYKFISAYRGVNRALKTGVKSSYPPYFNYKKGDPVSAEEYNPENVDGVTFAKGMMLVMGTYIVPATFLKEVTVDELAILMEQMGLSNTDTTTESQDVPIGDDNAINVADMPLDKAKLFDTSTKSLTTYGKDMAKFGVLGGALGFAGAYLVGRKQNKWLFTIIGATLGAVGVIVYKSATKNTTTSTPVTQQEVNNELPD